MDFRRYMRNGLLMKLRVYIEASRERIPKDSPVRFTLFHVLSAGHCWRVRSGHARYLFGRPLSSTTCKRSENVFVLKTLCNQPALKSCRQSQSWVEVLCVFGVFAGLYWFSQDGNIQLGKQSLISIILAPADPGTSSSVIVFLCKRVCKRIFSVSARLLSAGVTNVEV